ncbi:cupin domain-containing protein [Nonomuraea sp. NPDC050643]|uniref:cupin domain-containing protein n=1 Tax=Nonomuraea sp. NPDC050643 TaxID=3155660 RepID=UPI0033FD122C
MKVTWDDVTPNRRRGGDVRVLLSPRTVDAASGFGGALTLEPGEYICEHYHPYSEEFIHVVRGSLVMRVDGAPERLGPGDALMVPIGVRHRMENDGGEQAYVIFHLSPLAPRPELGHVDLETLPGAQDQPHLPVGAPGEGRANGGR